MGVAFCAAVVVVTANCSAPPAPPEPKVSPVASAGPDQTVDPGQTVTLDASGSSDPHSEPILYSWTASSDNPVPVVLTDSAQTQFEAPTTAGVYRFFLTVQAGERESAVDTVSVTVVAIGNGPPVAAAGLKTGPDTQSYPLDADSFVLDGSASTDPDGDPLTFLWELVSGPAAVVIEDSSAWQTSFTTADTGSYTFRLTVEDSIYTVTDELTINLFDSVGNRLPEAIAVVTPDSIVSIGTTITLDGSGSFDPEGDSLIYRWSVDPDILALSDSSAQQTTATPIETGTYVFRLVVEDSQGSDSQHAVINITVVEVFTSRNGMVEVPAGEFIMGTSSGQVFEGPPHAVELSTFWLDTFEVTGEQYRRCVDAGECTQADDTPKCNEGKPGRDQHPVNCVDWQEANTYCLWAGKRLPTEAEWEKAARGDDGRLFPWGDTPGPFSIPRRLNWNNEVGSTMPVGSYPSGVSFYGIHDMAGNVNEWTADLYGPDYYDNSPARDPQGPSEGLLRVARGGGWEIGQKAEAVVVTVRDAQNPTTRHHTVGFRCALTEPP